MKKMITLVLLGGVCIMPLQRVLAQEETGEAYSLGTLDRFVFSVFITKVELGGDAKEFEEYLDDIYTLGASASIPFTPYFSLLASAARTNVTSSFTEDGMNFNGDVTAVALSGGARIQFLPGQMFNPFVFGAYTYTNLDYEFVLDRETFSDSDSEKSISYGIGAELSFSERFTMVGSFIRTSPQDPDTRGFDWQGEGVDDPTEDRDSVSLSLNFWATPKVLLSLLYGYELDEKTATYGISLGISL